MGNSSGNPSLLLRRHHKAFEKSNTELTASLRANIVARQQLYQSTDPGIKPDGAGKSRTTTATTTNNPHPLHPPPLSAWTHHDRAANSLYVPSPPPPTGPPLSEPRAAYDITVKLFYLVHSSTWADDTRALAAARGAQAREALQLVTRELGVDGVDLLIVSFPGISFSADDESEDEDEDDELDDGLEEVENNNNSDPATQTNGGEGQAQAAKFDEEGFEPGDDDDMRAMLATHRAIEALHAEGLVQQLGVAELGRRRLARFLRRRRQPPPPSSQNPSSSSPPIVNPAVNQINLRDCCVVPRPLILLARRAHVELLTHNDCTDILPRGTLRSILGPPSPSPSPSSSSSSPAASGAHQQQQQTNGNASNGETTNGASKKAGGGGGDCVETVGREGRGGVGLLSSSESPDPRQEDDDNVAPLFVVKYTAVVRDRGVVENKGYFAVADLADAWKARHLER